LPHYALFEENKIMSVEIRTDLNLKIMVRALDDKHARIMRTSRADAKRAANRAEQSWADYSATYGRSLEILGKAESAERTADAEIIEAKQLIEDASEIMDAGERETALSAAREMLADARRRSAKAGDVAATLRDKLGDGVMTDFATFENALWAVVDAEDAKLAQIADVKREALIAGDKITKDDAERWFTLCGGLPVLLESTRAREARKARGEKGTAPKITASELDDLAALLA
jgi:hypothetical protein